MRIGELGRLGRLGRLPADVGVGLAAGLAGTVAMTVSSTVEMKLRGRSASDAPAQAAVKVLGVEPRDEGARTRFSTLMHWGYGTGWGAARGLLGFLGLRGAAAAGAHFATVWGTEQVMLPTLGVAPPATRWGVQEVALDAWHHLVYAAAAGTAYEILDGRR
ncbi:hypothetical protein N566_18890 [Streptomycetaceae bacterium MP113-05]|nr:hypothetical protein N566_18890 [Streptomycetaceae bacterium MP113-05]